MIESYLNIALNRKMKQRNMGSVQNAMETTPDTEAQELTNTNRGKGTSATDGSGKPAKSKASSSISSRSNLGRRDGTEESIQQESKTQVKRTFLESYEERTGEGTAADGS